MAGTAPDETSKFMYTMATTTDAQLLALLGTPTGNLFKVGPEHCLAKCARGTKLFDSVVGGEVILNASYCSWVYVRVIDITGVAKIKANWVFRAEFLS